MGISYGPSIVTNGLAVCLDAANSKSYPGSGTTWFDLSGNGRHGTLNNSPTYGTDSGGSFSFDAINDHVNIGSFTFTPYCLDFWLYNNNVVPDNDGAIGGPSTYQTLISYTYPSGVNLGGWTGSATNEALHIWSTDVSTKLTYTRTQVGIGIHNWVFNWNGSNYDIWVDGNKQTVYPSDGGHAVLQTFTSSINLAFGDTTNYYFHGKIYNFKLYTALLSDADVRQNFNAMRNRYRI